MLVEAYFFTMLREMTTRDQLGSFELMVILVLNGDEPPDLS